MSSQGPEPVRSAPARRRLGLVAFLLMLGAGLAFAGWFAYVREPVRLPNIDLGNASPQLAEAPTGETIGQIYRLPENVQEPPKFCGEMLAMFTPRARTPNLTA